MESGMRLNFNQSINHKVLTKPRHVVPNSPIVPCVLEENDFVGVVVVEPLISNEDQAQDHDQVLDTRNGLNSFFINR